MQYVYMMTKFVKRTCGSVSGLGLARVGYANTPQEAMEELTRQGKLVLTEWEASGSHDDVVSWFMPILDNEYVKGLLVQEVLVDDRVNKMSRDYREFKDSGINDGKKFADWLNEKYANALESEN